ncbi:MAG: serine hydrolase [Rhizobiales bacterium]|nr:serine hydrolase [Rhizobacter sp.]
MKALTTLFQPLRALARHNDPLLAAEAAQITSDNLAANVLLRQLGGPESFTRWLRGLGDRVTRLDRFEPELNRVPPGEERGTSTPTAFAATAAQLCTGPV